MLAKIQDTSIAAKSRESMHLKVTIYIGHKNKILAMMK